MTTIQDSTAPLGQLFSQHPAAVSQKWGLIFWGAVFISLGPIAYLGLGNLLAQPYMQQETSYGTPFITFLPLIISIGMPLLGIFFWYLAWRNWPLAANVYENGIELVNRKGSRKILWQDVENLTQHVVHHYYLIIPVGKSYSSTIQLHGGEIILFDNRYSKLKQLGQTLQERLAAIQLPESMDEIEAGNSLEFGALKLDREGIYHWDKRLTWNDVGKVNLKNTSLSITKKGSKFGNWANLGLDEVPNATLFCAIAQKLTANGQIGGFCR